MEQDKPDCFFNGIGPKEFDCSGLVICSIAEVLGINPYDWPCELRHVREMWRSSTEEQGVFQRGVLAEGSLMVTSRTYTIESKRMQIPGHIGIVSAALCGEIVWIHANPLYGQVEECPVNVSKSFKGVLKARDR